MKESEAIEVLKEKYQTLSMRLDFEVCKRNNQAISEAISALEEIQQYREFGTVQEIKELIADLVRYRELGTVEELKEIMQIISEGQDDVDDNGISTGLLHTLLQYSEYVKLGTIEELREAMDLYELKGDRANNKG